MRLDPHRLKRFVPTLLAVGVLVAGSLPTAAEDARFVPAKRPAKPAAAAPVKIAPRPAEPCPADDTAAQPGMRAFVDPATGQLREPTAEEAAELSRVSERRALTSRVALETVLPNGAVAIEVGEEFMNEVTVRKNADGSLRFQCAPKNDGKTQAAPAKAGDLETR